MAFIKIDLSNGEIIEGGLDSVEDSMENRDTDCDRRIPLPELQIVEVEQTRDRLEELADDVNQMPT